jgi:hypothetical protein
MSSIISGTGATVWPKTNLGSAGHNHSWSSPLLLVCTVPSQPALLPLFKCILDFLFHGCSAPYAILHRSPQLCQNGGLSVLSSIGETQKGRVGRDDRPVAFGKKILVKKRSVRLCFAVMQQPVRLSPKFGPKSLHILRSYRKASQSYTEFTSFFPLSDCKQQDFSSAYSTNVHKRFYVDLHNRFGLEIREYGHRDL